MGCDIILHMVGYYIPPNEIEYESQKVHAILFGSRVRFTPKDRLSFNLKDRRNKEIVGERELSHELLRGNGEVFLRLLKSRDESAISLGWDSGGETGTNLTARPSPS